MISQEAEIVTTQDGCHTIVSPDFGTSYHSIHGALEESRVVYIQTGLLYLLNMGLSSVKIFEMGFGTGLNALLTYLTAEEKEIDISYFGLEAYPLKAQIIEQLNFSSILEKQDLARILLTMHEMDELIEKKIGRYFTFCKQHQKLQDYSSYNKYDLIYYDAFAPSTQEELWTLQAMQQMFDMLNEGGVLVTYCAKGSFKRTLKACGFMVESLPGPGRKREITRALKPKVLP